MFSPGSSDMFSFHTIQGREGAKKDLILLRCARTSCVFK